MIAHELVIPLFREKYIKPGGLAPLCVFVVVSVGGQCCLVFAGVEPACRVLEVGAVPDRVAANAVDIRQAVACWPVVKRSICGPACCRRDRGGEAAGWDRG
jgi:hypothetical protein